MSRLSDRILSSSRFIVERIRWDAPLLRPRGVNSAYWSSLTTKNRWLGVRNRLKSQEEKLEFLFSYSDPKYLNRRLMVKLVKKWSRQADINNLIHQLNEIQNQPFLDDAKYANLTHTLTAIRALLQPSELELLALCNQQAIEDGDAPSSADRHFLIGCQLLVAVILQDQPLTALTPLGYAVLKEETAHHQDEDSGLRFLK